ncbi:MAG TPA: hypothetical protein EYP69_02365, partial [Bacteroidales bacterium]|nr:hypothetical protein [Bacteroidales bacterium]
MNLKQLLISLSFLLQVSFLFATHNRAGEITYRQIGPLKYEITLVTYTYSLSIADRPSLEVSWGDGTSSIVYRDEKISLPNYYNRNTYHGVHTYPGPGTYEIKMEDQNRNDGINNIPGSVNVPFTIKTTLQINPNEGNNNTPVLLNPPIDEAAVGKLFVHNPAAFDSDGDSISYGLTICLGNNGEPIPGYTLPPASNTFYVNPLTGDLVWDSPTVVGKYNVAMLIEEWRNGIKIGKIIRDMQIDVHETDNHPPVIDSIPDICVVAGTTVQVSFTVTDVDNDYISLTGEGGPFILQNSASLGQTSNLPGHATGQFTWQTTCDNVRKQPYEVIIKATDNNNDLSLVHLMSFNITVIAPEPQNLLAVPGNTTVALSWDADVCSNAAGYYVFRRQGSYAYNHNDCETGIPLSTGYVKIGEIQGWNSTTFIDDNNGNGLLQGYDYCYRVDAFFEDKAESYISEEVCTPLVRGIPIMTNVSVETTDSINGKIYVAWSKPIDFDSIAAPGPYKYLIYRSNDIWGLNLQLIDSLSGINDTIYIDSLIDTKNYPYSYQVAFYNDEAGNRFLIGTPQVASSVFLHTIPGDNNVYLSFEKNVPWINTSYIVYRWNETTQTFDSIAVTGNEYYADTSLKNGVQYCYKVKSMGGYNIQGVVYPIINFSQKKCDIPEDSNPPCQPQISVSSFCENLYNNISWHFNDDSCLQDVVSYNLYYSEYLDDAPTLLTTISNPSQMSYEHIPQFSMAGCYRVSAIDSVGNESALSEKVCVDSCN